MAEGTKKRLKGIEIVNSEPFLLNIFLEFFSCLGIKKTSWALRIVFNQKLMRWLQKDKLEKYAKEFWNKQCALSPNKIRYAGTADGKMRKSTPFWGSLNLNYSNVVMRKFFFSLFEKIKLLVFENEELATDFLKGYISGEAYVGARDRELQIACADDEERIFIASLFNNIGIKCSFSKRSSTAPPKILITYFDGFCILRDKDIFEFHPYKKKNLLSKILRYKCLDADERVIVEKSLKKVNSLIEEREKNRPRIEKFPY